MCVAKQEKLLSSAAGKKTRRGTLEEFVELSSYAVNFKYIFESYFNRRIPKCYFHFYERGIKIILASCEGSGKYLEAGSEQTPLTILN